MHAPAPPELCSAFFFRSFFDGRNLPTSYYKYLQ
jgi:hypothetical protein